VSELKEEIAMKQRDMMRQLFSRLRKKEAIVAAYAKAEDAGQISRKKNTRQISSHAYAERLFEDGVRKGWITER